MMECLKEGEGSSQRTCMNDPWTWTTVWGWPEGVGIGRHRGRQRVKIWDNYNRINKNNKKNDYALAHKETASTYRLHVCKMSAG